MASARPCRRCRALFIPRGRGRPPVFCEPCRAEQGVSTGSEEPEPEFWRQMRDQVRGRAGEALEDVAHDLHIEAQS